MANPKRKPGSRPTEPDKVVRRAYEFLERLLTSLLRGTKTSTIRRAMRAFGRTQEEVDDLIYRLISDATEEARVDVQVEIAKTMRRLDFLINGCLFKGDHRGALKVVDRQIRLMSLPNYVRYRPQSRPPKSEYDRDFEELEPWEREKAGSEFRRRVSQLAAERRARKSQLAGTSNQPRPESAQTESGRSNERRLKG